jgi:hypothetical protein
MPLGDRFFRGELRILELGHAIRAIGRARYPANAFSEASTISSFRRPLTSVGDDSQLSVDDTFITERLLNLQE